MKGRREDGKEFLVEKSTSIRDQKQERDWHVAEGEPAWLERRD